MQAFLLLFSEFVDTEILTTCVVLQSKPGPVPLYPKCTIRFRRKLGVYLTGIWRKATIFYLHLLYM